MINLFDEPEFQAMVRRAKWHKLWSLCRCIYCWILLLAPALLLGRMMRILDRTWLWVYVICIPFLFVWGVVLWCKGSNGLFAPAHRWLVKFNKDPSETYLRRICAVLVSGRTEHRYPKVDLDLMRRAQSVAQHNPDKVPSALLAFYTTLLQACHVAGA